MHLEQVVEYLVVERLFLSVEEELHVTLVYFQSEVVHHIHEVLESYLFFVVGIEHVVGLFNGESFLFEHLGDTE